MSHSQTEFPERLLDGDATAFERRLLEAGTRKGPPPELLARMAQGIGVSATAAGAAVVAKQVAATTAAGKVTAGTGKALWLPWILTGALALVVTGVVVGTRVGKTVPVPAPANVANPPPVVARANPPAEASLAKTETAAPASSDLRDQVALMDLARAALKAGHGRRALELAQQYQDKYPKGHFLPEAAALRIEALVGQGRLAEARGLAERFIADHPGSPLADRVAKLAGPLRP